MTAAKNKEGKGSKPLPLPVYTGPKIDFDALPDKETKRRVMGYVNSREASARPRLKYPGNGGLIKPVGTVVVAKNVNDALNAPGNGSVHPDYIAEMLSERPDVKVAMDAWEAWGHGLPA